MTSLCDVCGETARVWHYVNYEHPPGYWKQDIEGDFMPGAGRCDECGKYFCAEHNELSGGLCPACNEENENFVLE